MILLLSRVLRILGFDASVYEEIEADRHATWQAVVVVLMSSLCLGLAIGGIFELRGATLGLAALLALVTWMAWAMLTLQLGTRWFPGRETRSSFGEMLRTVGFAAAPGLLQIFAVFPRMRVPIIGITSAWMFVAMVVAVQHALDYRHLSRAILVCAVAATLALAMAFFFGLAAGTVVV